MAALPDVSAWKEGTEEDIVVMENCYCPNCEVSKATTTMLPTKVPFFREIILMNLCCDECGFRNAEVNFGGEIQEKGERWTLTVRGADDLNRQIIKSDSASISIPALQFEIPPTTQRGNVTTIEGMLGKAAEQLEALQPERLRLGDVDNFHRCHAVIKKLKAYIGQTNDDDDDEEEHDNEDKKEEKENLYPFELILDDPAGNSYIENPKAPQADPALRSAKYWRTATQDMALGLQPSQQAVQDGTIDDNNPKHKNVVNAAAPTSLESRPIQTDLILQRNRGGSAAENSSTVTDADNKKIGREEVIKFTTTCPHCHRPTETDMCMTDIPHFKEVIIMSMLCENCGFRSNEVKGGGAIPKYGNRITLSVQTPDDLAREVLKSDTAGLTIPEVDLELEEGGLDGVYTTVEGLLNKVKKRLEQANPFGRGDSATKQHSTNDGGAFSAVSPYHQKYMEFLNKLQDLADGKILPFHLIISDPLANSFVGPIPKDAVALALQAEKDGHNQCYEDYIDPGMNMEEYERTHEQNEVLGLNDMKTENYQDKTQNGSGAGHSEYYGTDTMEEVPDRIRRLDIRGPDHPHQVGKAPVEGDTTVMGAGSVNFAVPAMRQRGKRVSVGTVVVPGKNDQAVAAPSFEGEIHVDRTIAKLVHDSEFNDQDFVQVDGYDGPREGFVYKNGALGLGYYKDIPLAKLVQDRKGSNSR